MNDPKPSWSERLYERMYNAIESELRELREMKIRTELALELRRDATADDVHQAIAVLYQRAESAESKAEVERLTALLDEARAQVHRLSKDYDRATAAIRKLLAALDAPGADEDRAVELIKDLRERAGAPGPAMDGQPVARQRVGR